MENETLLIVGIIGSVLVVINLIFLLIIFSMRRKAAAASTWPSTSGTVMVSTLQSRRSSNNHGRVNYPFVLYTYKVMGNVYQGNRIAPGMEVGGSGAAGMVARYPVGAAVPVYYNPDDPSEAVLEQKAPAMFWMWFMLIVIDLMLGGGMAISAFAFSI